MRLVCRERSRVKMSELGSVSESKRVQRLHRPSMLYNSRLVFFFRFQEPFCLQSISNNAGEALFVKYVVGIWVVFMEVVCPDLWVLTNEMSKLGTDQWNESLSRSHKQGT